MSVDTREVAANLTRSYYPFNLLSPARAREAFEAVRFFSLREGEELTLVGGSGRDYIYALEGAVSVEHDLAVEPLTAQAGAGWRKPMFMPPAPYKTRISAKTGSIVCHADSGMFDFLLLWDELPGALGDGEGEIARRLRSVRNCLAFQGLRLEAAAEAFRRMKRVPAAKGVVVCSKGEPGAAYYVIESGAARAFEGDAKVADLGPGDALGAMARLDEHICSATVRMTEDGSLLVLPIEDFEAISSIPLAPEIAPEQVKEDVAGDRVLLDVRYEMEREESRIPGSMFIPLHDLAKKMDKLDRGREYVVYCRSGKRSRAAVRIMVEKGFRALSLKGGIIGWPYEIEGDTY